MPQMSFDDLLKRMLEDCALVSTSGKIVDLTEARVRRQSRSLISYRRLYAPQARVGRGPRGGQALVHVVDTWLHHPERKTVYPGELEYPLQDWEWWHLEQTGKPWHSAPLPEHLRDTITIEEAMGIPPKRH